MKIVVRRVRCLGLGRGRDFPETVPAEGRSSSPPYRPHHLFVYTILRCADSLVDVVTVREVQSLRRRQMATRKRCVAVIVARPASQSPIICGDCESTFFDLHLR